MNWAQLSLDAPGFIGNQVRAAGVLRNTQRQTLPDDVAHAIFHQDASTGSAVATQPSLVRFFGNGTTVRVLGVTTPGALLLLDNAVALASLWDANGKRFTLTDGTFESYPSYPHAYAIRAFATRITPAARPHLLSKAFDAPLLLDDVRHRLDAAIARQLAWLLPATPTRPIADLSIDRSVAVKVHGSTHYALLDVRFTLPLVLKGPWQFGKLQA